MTKRLDPDIKALGMCIRALEASSSRRMQVANVVFLYDRYILHPQKPKEKPPRHRRSGGTP